MDIAYRKYMQTADFKQCEQCSSPIEKNGGCNHMTCTHCKFEFCWICGSPFKVNHYSLFNLRGCPGLQFLDLGEEEVEIEEVVGGGGGVGGGGNGGGFSGRGGGGGGRGEGEGEGPGERRENLELRIDVGMVKKRKVRRRRRITQCRRRVYIMRSIFLLILAILLVLTLGPVLLVSLAAAGPLILYYSGRIFRCSVAEMGKVFGLLILGIVFIPIGLLVAIGLVGYYGVTRRSIL